MDVLGSFWFWTLAAAGIHVLICGGFGAYVSGAKGRSWLEGLMFGLILGPIGVVAAACLPDDRKLKLDKTATYQARGIADLVEVVEEATVRQALAQMKPKPGLVEGRHAGFPDLDL
jgi:hypothetical protein